ncbi:GGDEF domain-containing protein [Bosea rubneri]|uniref:diguanylate cyclase n=1 Tax=Bosea rubneri TaxID=3075434 RepID=A0ABU3S7M0_9HYPH|nr:diguanylate cyclase [Bosea sp. ZW T0_25]MDU0340335.1 diguanylate cyclase [Bosea sp. ZW T0_25]
MTVGRDPSPSRETSAAEIGRTTSPALLALRRAALLAVVTFGAALFGHLTRPVGFLASFWVANALLIGILVRAPQLATFTGWLAIAAGYLAADFAMGGGFLLTLWLTAANLAGVVAGFVLFQRIDPTDRRLERPQSLLFLLLISAAAAGAAAIVGSGSIIVFFGGSLRHAVELYLTSELASNLVVLPMVLTAPPLRTLREHAGALGRSVRPLLPVAALLVSIAAGSMIGGSGAISAPMPALLWCALSYGVFPTAVLTFATGLWQGTALVTNLPPSAAEFLPAVIAHRLSLALLALGPIMVSSINSARSELVKELNRAANEDSLTGTLSRRAFMLRSEAVLAESARRGASLALLMLDADQFKRINDEHGHAAGDAALVALTRQIGAMLRPQDLFGRMGGEEFAIVLPETEPVDALAVAERLREACANIELMLDNGRLVRITMSIGLVCRPAATVSLQSLLKQADEALYAAKRDGRNRVVQAAPLAA